MNEAITAVSSNNLLVRCSTILDKRTYKTIASDLIQGVRNYTFLNKTVKAIEFYLIDHQLDVVEIEDQDKLTFEIKVIAKHIQTDEINKEIQQRLDKMNED